MGKGLRKPITLRRSSPARPPGTVGPPLMILGTGAISVVLSYVLFLLNDSNGANIAGYLLGSVFPILSIGFFRRFDLSRRKSPLYISNPAKTWLPPTIAIAGFIAAALHTWQLATGIAR